MDVNTEIMKLHDITGLDVQADLYTGKNSSYIVFTYTDERPVFWGDDDTLADEVTIQVSLYTPPKSDHMDYKHKIRDYLETLGEINDISSWIDTYMSKNNLEVAIRHTTFNVTITKER